MMVLALTRSVATLNNPVRVVVQQLVLWGPLQPMSFDLQGERCALFCQRGKRGQKGGHQRGHALSITVAAEHVPRLCGDQAPASSALT